MHKDGAGPHRGHPSAHAPGPFWSILSALSQEDSTVESLVASLHLQPLLPNRSPLQTACRWAPCTKIKPGSSCVHRWPSHNPNGSSPTLTHWSPTYLWASKAWEALIPTVLGSGNRSGLWGVTAAPHLDPLSGSKLTHLLCSEGQGLLTGSVFSDR